jgi:hypothetical protein
LYAARIVGLLLGLCTLGVLAMMVRQFALSSHAAMGVAFSAVPLMLLFSLFGSTMADALLVLLLLLYCRVAFFGDDSGIRYGLLSGLIGGLAYLTKAYALPFFLSHYLIITSHRLFTAEKGPARRRALRNSLCGLLVFAVISGTWTALLSAKYGRLTYSTSGPFNLSLLDPARARTPPVSNLTPPPNDTAITAWEDPCFRSIPTWNPFQSRRDLAHYAKEIVQNLHETLMILLEFSAFSGAILAAYVLWLCHRGTLQSHPGRLFYPLITAVLFCGGYNLVLIERRYLWLCCVLLLLMGAYLFDRLTEHAFFTKARRGCLLTFLVASFSFTPLYNLAYCRNGGTGPYVAAEGLRSHIGHGEHMASDSAQDDSSLIAFHLGARYYGTRKWNGSIADCLTDLEHHGIQHFLIWEASPSEAPSLPGYTRIHVQGMGTPLLYSRQPN